MGAAAKPWYRCNRCRKFVLFEDNDQASLLMKVFPMSDWTKVGGLDSLPYSAFASLMLEAGMTLSPGAGGGETFGG